jgi:antitoxin component of RelBE/YafQ-DinJ toxin-antitoxin module
MIKEKDILIRIEQETKQKASERAKLIGLSMSAWIRTLIIKELNKEI